MTNTKLTYSVSKKSYFTLSAPAEWSVNGKTPCEWRTVPDLTSTCRTYLLGQTLYDITSDMTLYLSWINACTLEQCNFDEFDLPSDYIYCRNLSSEFERDSKIKNNNNETVPAYYLPITITGEDLYNDATVSYSITGKSPFTGYKSFSDKIVKRHFESDFFVVVSNDVNDVYVGCFDPEYEQYNESLQESVSDERNMLVGSLKVNGLICSNTTAGLDYNDLSLPYVVNLYGRKVLKADGTKYNFRMSDSPLKMDFTPAEGYRVLEYRMLEWHSTAYTTKLKNMTSTNSLTLTQPNKTNNYSHVTGVVIVSKRT